MIGTFQASVQYGDWEGTAAADDADHGAFEKYMRGQGLLQSGEWVLATSLWIGENQGGKLGYISVRAFVYSKADTMDNLVEVLNRLNGPIPCRTVDIKLGLEEFLVLYKRFAVMLTRRGLGLGGREFDVPAD